MERTALFDGSYLLYLLTVPVKEIDFEGHPLKSYRERTINEIIDSIPQSISNLCFAVKADSYIGYLDSGKNFRHEIYPEYKSQ